MCFLVNRFIAFQTCLESLHETIFFQLLEFSVTCHWLYLISLSFLVFFFQILMTNLCNKILHQFLWLSVEVLLHALLFCFRMAYTLLYTEIKILVQNSTTSSEFLIGFTCSRPEFCERKEKMLFIEITITSVINFSVSDFGNFTFVIPVKKIG